MQIFNFDFDDGANGKLVLAKDGWIFLLVALPLTAITLVLAYLYMWHVARKRKAMEAKLAASKGQAPADKPTWPPAPPPPPPPPPVTATNPAPAPPNLISALRGTLPIAMGHASPTSVPMHYPGMDLGYLSPPDSVPDGSSGEKY